MDNESAHRGAPPPSNFVNVLAWIFIILGGFATAISIVQNVMIQFMFDRPEMSHALHQARHSDQVPAFAAFMFNHFQLFFLLFLLLSATSLVAAIGLLKRKNWARLLFIALMVLGIAWNLGGLVLHFTMFNQLPHMAQGDMPHDMGRMMGAMKIFTSLVALAFAGLFAWIIRKLTSAPIRAEFGRP